MVNWWRIRARGDLKSEKYCNGCVDGHAIGGLVRGGAMVLAHKVSRTTTINMTHGKRGIVGYYKSRLGGMCNDERGRGSGGGGGGYDGNGHPGRRTWQV